jgi:hypothetical protein
MRKIMGMRYILVFAALLFLANIAIAVYTANRHSEGRIPRALLADFFEMYESDREYFAAEYAVLLQIQEEQNVLRREAWMRGDRNFEPEFPNKYTDSDDYNDLTLFNELFSRRQYVTDYPRIIQRVIRSAYVNIDEFNIIGISEDSYTYKYQLKIIELYTNAKSEVKMELEHTRGWGEFFSYDISNIFIFALLVMIGSVVFAQEKNSGFIAIIKTAKNGRSKTALAKIGATLVLTAGVTLAFTFSTMAVFGFMHGFSSMGNAIQIFNDFLFCPAVITVGQYFLINIALKFLVFSLFSCIILMISTFIHNYAINYLCGFALFGLNFLLYTTNFIDADNPLRHLNFISVAAVKPLYIRYRSLNFFDNLYGYVPFMIIAFSVLLIAASAVAVISFNKTQGGGLAIGRITILSKIWLKIKSLFLTAAEKISSGLPKRRAYSLSIFIAETFKTIIAKRYILAVIALIAVKLYISSGEYVPSRSYADAVYKQYMTTLKGELTDEKREYIANERAYFNDILSRNSEMLEKYLADDIDFEEYWKYLSDYHSAYSRSEIFTVIEEHLQYIDQTAGQKNLDAWFVYDTGWMKLFHNGFDILLYGLILLLFSGIFADEYMSRSSSGSFAQILRSTKNGRQKTFAAKLISALTVTVLLTVVFHAIDAVLIWRNFDLPAIDAPLISLQSFGAINGGITIMQYIILYFSIRLLANLLFAAFVLGLSELLKKTISVMSVTAAFTLFPALFAYFGLGIFSYVDFTGLLGGTQIYLLSARTGLIGDMGLLGVFALCCAGVACVLTYRARNDYVK